MLVSSKQRHRNGEKATYVLGCGAMLLCWSLYQGSQMHRRHANSLDEGGLPVTTLWQPTKGGSEAVCSAIQAYAQERLKTEALLIKGGATEWPASQLAVDLAALTALPLFSGQVLISPTKEFSLFNNNLVASAMVEAGNTSALPNRIVDDMDFVEFYSRFRGHEAPLFYEQEQYYFQGEAPPGLRTQEGFAARPLACLQPDQSQPGAWHLEFKKERLRVSPKGSSHALHHDTQGTLIAVLRGRKKVTLLPPGDLQRLYPYPREHLLSRRAQVDLRHPDYTEFPMSEGLRPVTVVLHPGDVLMFPAGSAHALQMVEESISLSMRYKVKHYRPPRTRKLN